jgi:RNA polymerase sigma-70 factor (ECF subfamily)
MDTLHASATPFELLYARHGRQVLAYAFSWLHDRHTAEDVLQEVFAQLHRRMARDGPLNGGGREFLFSVARHRIIDRLRRRRARGETGSLADAPEPQDVGPTRMDGPFEQAEMHRLINRALLALPDAQREVVVLRVFARMSFDAVSRLTGAPLATVASRYRYALGKMAPLLKELWVES